MNKLARFGVLRVNTEDADAHRPTPPVVLTTEERETLEQWARRPKTAQALAQRTRIVLACATDKTNGDIALGAGVTRQTVGRWRPRSARKRLNGLLDEPRPGAPRTIRDADVERVVRLTLETTPRDATHSSTRAMPTRSGLSQSAISRIWRAFALQPQARLPRFYVHFTPTGSSWINLVERWSAALTEQQVRRGVHRSTRELEAAIRRYIELTNDRPTPFVWTKTADEILASVARFCHRISNSGR